MEGGWTNTATTIGALIATVALVSGLSPISNLAPSAAASSSGTATFHCTYEGGGAGDLIATIANDQVGQTQDGYVDQGGCLWVSSNLQDSICAQSVTRKDGTGAGLGELTLDAISDEIQISTTDAQNQNASTACQLRELPTFSSDTVQVTAEIIDDVYGREMSGAMCGDTDDDNVACENLEPHRDEFCTRSGTVGKTIQIDDYSKVDHFAIFVNGPANSGSGSEKTSCGGDDDNPIGGTSGGIFNPSAGIYVEFDPQ